MVPKFLSSVKTKTNCEEIKGEFGVCPVGFAKQLAAI